jgi:nucleotide-binding universal stress UspA family protein
VYVASALAEPSATTTSREGIVATPAIRTSGLSKRFGDTLALDGLDVVVAEGEVVGCLGPNGAGTLVRLLLGLLVSRRAWANASCSSARRIRSLCWRPLARLRPGPPWGSIDVARGTTTGRRFRTLPQLRDQHLRAQGRHRRGLSPDRTKRGVEMEATIEDRDMRRRIVVGIDGSDCSLKALEWAAEQARLTGCPLRAVITWEWPITYGYPVVWPDDVSIEADAGCLLEESVEKVPGADSTSRVELVVVEGHAAPVLCGESESASLVVVGSRGHGEFAGMLLGSVSEFLATHAACPVVIVRHDDVGRKRTR